MQHGTRSHCKVGQIHEYRGGNLQRKGELDRKQKTSPNLEYLTSTRWCPSLFAKLVNITPMSQWFIVDISIHIYTIPMVYKPTYNYGDTTLYQPRNLPFQNLIALTSDKAEIIKTALEIYLITSYRPRKLSTVGNHHPS